MPSKDGENLDCLVTDFKTTVYFLLAIAFRAKENVFMTFFMNVAAQCE